MPWCRTPLRELGSGSEVSVLLRRYRKGAPDCKDEGITNVSPLRRSRLVTHLQLAAVHACFAVPALEPFGASRCCERPSAIARKATGTTGPEHKKRARKETGTTGPEHNRVHSRIGQGYRHRQVDAAHACLLVTPSANERRTVRSSGNGPCAAATLRSKEKDLRESQDQCALNPRLARRTPAR